MRALVTGAAGFIGSHLVDRLLSDEHHVVGLDSFTDYYSGARKRANLQPALASERFELVEADLCNVELERLVGNVDVVFHQAGQPGVRRSWAQEFDVYVRNNIVGTQRLLEASRTTGLARLVYASSSSIYGEAATYPTPEGALPAPRSPYGVTKLAAEHLCTLYAATWAVPTVALRYFTVYGSRQRPDMATHRVVEAALGGEPFAVFGDGKQIRDFTHVHDVVAANIAAAEAATPGGTVMNIAGGSATTLLEVVSIVESLTGREVDLDFQGDQPGDVHRTGADTEAANRLLGWEPTMGLADGIAEQVAWHREVSDER